MISRNGNFCSPWGWRLKVRKKYLESRDSQASAERVRNIVHTIQMSCIKHGNIPMDILSIFIVANLRSVWKIFLSYLILGNNKKHNITKEIYWEKEIIRKKTMDQQTTEDLEDSCTAFDLCFIFECLAECFGMLGDFGGL